MSRPRPSVTRKPEILFEVVRKLRAEVGGPSFTSPIASRRSANSETASLCCETGTGSLNTRSVKSRTVNWSATWWGGRSRTPLSGDFGRTGWRGARANGRGQRQGKDQRRFLAAELRRNRRRWGPRWLRQGRSRQSHIWSPAHRLWKTSRSMARGGGSQGPRGRAGKPGSSIFPKIAGGGARADRERRREHNARARSRGRGRSARGSCERGASPILSKRSRRCSISGPGCRRSSPWNSPVVTSRKIVLARAFVAGRARFTYSGEPDRGHRYRRQSRLPHKQLALLCREGAAVLLISSTYRNSSISRIAFMS